MASSCSCVCVAPSIYITGIVRVPSNSLVSSKSSYCLMGNCCGTTATVPPPLSAPSGTRGGRGDGASHGSQTALAPVSSSEPASPDPRSHRQPNAVNGSLRNTASPSSLVPDNEHASLPSRRVAAPPTSSSLLTPLGTGALNGRTRETEVPGLLHSSFPAASISRTTSELPSQSRVPVLPPSAVSRVKSGTGYLGSANPKDVLQKQTPPTWGAKKVPDADGGAHKWLTSTRYGP